MESLNLLLGAFGVLFCEQLERHTGIVLVW